MTEVILALDVATADAAEQLLDTIPAVRWVKLGSALMTGAGGPLVTRLAGRGLGVFLDLKWHDIPNTVAFAVSQARDLGARMVTVHTLGGRRMLDAAVAASEGALAVLGVTVLTSHDAMGYGEAVGRSDVNLDPEVVRLATLARQSGLAGVVCSPREVTSVRQVLGPGALVVVPGIRRAGDSPGDQQRIATPAAAATAGATHLVVGRPVLESPDPAAAFGAMLREAGGAVG